MLTGFCFFASSTMPALVEMSEPAVHGFSKSSFKAFSAPSRTDKPSPPIMLEYFMTTDARDGMVAVTPL